MQILKLTFLVLLSTTVLITTNATPVKANPTMECWDGRLECDSSKPRDVESSDCPANHLQDSWNRNTYDKGCNEKAYTCVRGHIEVVSAKWYKANKKNKNGYIKVKVKAVADSKQYIDKQLERYRDSRQPGYVSKTNYPKCNTGNIVFGAIKFNNKKIKNIYRPLVNKTKTFTIKGVTKDRKVRIRAVYKGSGDKSVTKTFFTLKNPNKK